jgi:hypothetical protein
MRRLWIQFFNRKLDGKLGEALGSEGLQRLDGRLGVRSATQEAYSRAYNLRKVQDYEAFQIMSGSSPRDLRPVTGVVDSNYRLWKDI